MEVERGNGLWMGRFPQLTLTSLTWPYQGSLHSSFSLVSHCAPYQGHVPQKGASENLELSFGGVTEPPQGSPFLCIVARRSCPLGCAPPPAAVSPAS